MNETPLLAHFEQICEAPDAIPRLHRFVIDLAVRGKLVQQDPSDEPASEALKRIASEKARLVQKGALREYKPTSPVTAGETEFDLPEGWAWARIGDIIKLWNGFAFKSSDFQSEGIPVIRIGDLQNGEVVLSGAVRVSEKVANTVAAEMWVPPNALLIAMSGATTGKTAFNRTGAALLLNQRVGRIDVFSMSIHFVRLFFETIVARNLSISSGTAIPNLSTQQINEIVIGLPPIEEQYRIVGKVGELMELFDQLEAARREREAQRDRLTLASLARLNAVDAESFWDDTRFVVNTLAALTTRRDQIKHLRQTILNLAVRGELVQQDSMDEPTSELQKRIAMEKAQLVMAGEIKKEKLLDPISEDAHPFKIPAEWRWIRLDALSRLITKGSSPKWQGVNYVNAEEGILFVTSENVGSYKLRKLDELKYVEARFRDIEPRSMLKRGDILMNLVGASIGRTALYDFDAEANINQAVALVRLVQVPSGPFVDYLLHYFNSPLAIDFMLGSRVTTAQPNMSLTDVREFPIPLPPLAEQHRIVAKVNELMELCDQLEASLRATNERLNGLVTAILSEALLPAGN